MSRRTTPKKKKMTSTSMFLHEHCKTCGIMLEDITQEFCSDRCRVEHEEKERQRKRQSYFVGFSFLAYIVIVIAFVVLRPIFF
ncbi:MAG: DUF2116 family Zn-ribbon domain-containing protein [Candidatus Ranarchaeia archaeon]